MEYCSCGNPVEGPGKRCARCGALDVLDLPANADENQIRDAYRVLVKVWHPDRFAGDARLQAAAEEKLRALNAAHALLTSEATPKIASRNPRQPAGQTYKAEMARLPQGDAPQTGAQQGGAGRAKPSVAARKPRLGRVGFALAAGGALLCGLLILLYALTIRPAQQGDAAGEAQAQSGDPSLTANFSTPAAQGAHRREMGAARSAPARLMPYVTTGLTKEEVIAAVGAPTSATDDTLVYGGSKLYLTGGKVSGWKIDPASPIRVKLWPDASVDPDLDSFGVGSSKDVVLVVQGTPTYFSANTYGYGGSEVYFQNGRVVSWKNDPAWPLRIAPR